MKRSFLGAAMNKDSEEIDKLLAEEARRQSPSKQAELEKLALYDSWIQGALQNYSERAVARALIKAGVNYSLSHLRALLKDIRESKRSDEASTTDTRTQESAANKNSSAFSPAEEPSKEDNFVSVESSPLAKEDLNAKRERRIAEIESIPPRKRLFKDKRELGKLKEEEEERRRIDRLYPWQKPGLTAEQSRDIKIQYMKDNPGFFSRN